MELKFQSEARIRISSKDGFFNANLRQSTTKLRIFMAFVSIILKLESYLFCRWGSSF